MYFSRRDLHLSRVKLKRPPVESLWVAFWSILLTFFGISYCCHADDRIPCPQTFPPHPRLFTNPGELRTLKNFIRNSAEARRFVDNLITRVEKELNHIPNAPVQPRDMENRNISTLARDFAIAYILTGKEQFAAAAKQILLSYAEVYPSYAVTATKGKAMPSTLNEARWIIDLATAYDLIYSSPALHTEDKKQIEDQVFRPCGEVLRICNHKTRSNWRARAIAGLGVIGFCIGDCDFIDEAINGYRDENDRVLRNGFIQHLGYSILGDGIFYERSFGYQAYTTDSYFLLMEAARHSGVDLWHHSVSADPRDAGSDIERLFGPPEEKSVKAVFDALFYRSFSDGAVTNVANASADFFIRRRYYEAAWRAWRDPKYAYVARIHESDRRPWDGISLRESARIRDAADLFWIDPSLPKGHFALDENAVIGNTGSHVNGCTLFPNGGFAILRQSTDPDAVCAEMNFGCWGSGHSHPDKLSIVISDGNHKVIREARYFGYGDPAYLTWDRQTIAHNTVTVDHVSQQPQGDTDNAWAIPKAGSVVRGRPLLFYAGNQLKAFRAECTDAYPGVRMERTIVLIDSVVYDFFKVESESNHRYDYALHIDAPVTIDRDQVRPHTMEALSHEFGYRHIKINEAGMAPLTAHLGYGRKIAALTPSQVLVGKGIAAKKHSGMPVMILQTEGKKSVYVTAFILKPNATPIQLIKKDHDYQTVMIGEGRLLENNSAFIALRDRAGKILEIAR